jgi:hypothetical protein
MDLQDQLKILHEPAPEEAQLMNLRSKKTYDLQIRKRKGKVTTV